MSYQTPEHKKFHDLRPDFIEAFFKGLFGLFRLPFTHAPHRFTQLTHFRSKYHQMMLEILRWAPTKIHTKSTLPYVSQANSDGDSCLWGGLLAATGHRTGKNTLKTSFGNDRFWRSPNRVGEAGEDTFSRDQLLGVLAYGTTDGDFFHLFVTHYFLQLGKNKWKMCESSDGRGELRGTTKALVYRLFKFRDTTNYLPWHWRLWTMFDGIVQYFSACVNKTGYRLHLIAITIFISSFLQGKKPSKLQTLTLKVLVSRQPNNPFFQYLLNGLVAITDNLAVKYAPKVEPIGNHSCWTLQTDTDQEEWKDSMGWEWIFLFRVFQMEDNWIKTGKFLPVD